MPTSEFTPHTVGLPLWLFDALFSTNRWFHLVASTLLVGGVLFFAFVVPIATSDLKVENQLAVFGKARWMFRKIVGWSILALLVTGAVSLWRMWSIYSMVQSDVHGFWFGSTPWAMAHLIVAILGSAILVRVTATRKLLGHPVPWMWVVLMLLLAGMFLASITRQIRLNIEEQMSHQNVPLAAR